MKKQTLNDVSFETGLLYVPGHDHPFVIIEATEAAAYGVSLLSLIESLKEENQTTSQEVFLTILEQLIQLLTKPQLIHLLAKTMGDRLQNTESKREE